MIIPPPNPRAAESAAAMRDYNAPLLANPPHESVQEVVIVQWHRSDVTRTFSEHDVEMWWTMARSVTAATQAAQVAHDTPERTQR